MATQVVDEGAESSEEDDGYRRLLTVRTTTDLLVLILPVKRFTLRQIKAVGSVAEHLRWIDLEDGTVSEIAVTTAGSQLQLQTPIAVSRPALLVQNLV